jgi:ferric-dicitrate binding protein FerR (iron transport regulator)
MDNKLLQKYIAGDANKSETQQVVEWMKLSDDNRREYMAQRKLYDIALWRTNRSDDEEEAAMGSKWTFKMVLKETIKIAAVIAIVFSATYYWTDYRLKNEKGSLQSVYAPAGQRTEIRLSDGTKVWLNARSSLTYSDKFVGDCRRVRLNGEAYFIVSKNKAKPFIVQTGKYNIKVLGTEFNVSAYHTDEEWRTSLLNGKVEIVDNNGQSLMQLEPNTEAYLKDGKLVKSRLNAAETFAWRRGLLSFTKLSMAEMVKKFELYYGVRIVVNNRQLLENSYTGKFFIGDGIEHALDVLKIDNTFTYIYDTDKCLITIN